MKLIFKRVISLEKEINNYMLIIQIKHNIYDKPISIYFIEQYLFYILNYIFLLD